MNSSNSFNICPRCGNSNSLNAKYCSRCGAQLKVPTEAVVCHKCHTRNSSLANFCRNCGATLKVGAQTKICPRCGREIGAEENMCACGYSFVNKQQAEPRRADVSSTNKESKRDKKREKNKVVDNSYVESNGGKEKQPKQKKGGRGFAIFAFLVLAVFVVAILLPASARGPLVNIDKGFYHPVEENEPQATVDTRLPLYAEGDEESEPEPIVPTPTPSEDEEEEPTPVETWTVTFKNGETTVATVTVTKGQKLTAEQIPAAPSVAENKEFKGWFSGETQITTETAIEGDIVALAEIADVQQTAPITPNPTETNPSDTDQSETAEKLEYNVYGWDFINDIIALLGGEISFDSIKTGLGTSTLMMVAMFAIFMLTAVFHLLVCIFRMIAPTRSKRANLLYLILAVITTILVLMMNFAHLIPDETNAFRMFFAPSYKGMACEYGLMIWVIPVYYWFFWLYSCIAKRKMPKKEKKSKKDK